MLAPGGSYAEYAVAWSHTTFHIPAKVSFEATIPLAALTAIVSLYHHHRLPLPWTPPAPAPATKRTPLLIYGGSTAVGAFAIKLARLSNIHPIIAIAGRGASYISRFLDPAHGDAIVDYRDGAAKTIAGVKAALAAASPSQGSELKLEHILDTIVSETSSEVIRNVVAPGGQVNYVLPCPYDVSPGVKTNTWVSSAHEVGGAADARDLCFVFCRWFGRALAEGTFEGHPWEVREKGLLGVEGAMRDLRDGKASAVNNCMFNACLCTIYNTLHVKNRRLIHRRVDVRSTATSREAPPDLTGHGDLHIQVLSEGPGQAGVLLESTANEDHVNAVLLHDFLGLTTVGDGTNRRHKQLVTNSLLDRSGERNLETGAGLHLLGSVHTAGADVDQIDGALLDQLLGELDGAVVVPALLGEDLLQPVGSRDAEEDGHVGADRVTGQLGNLQGEADAVLERATVLVGAVVGSGGQERREKVSVGVVDLDEVNPDRKRALDGSNPVVLELDDVVLGHRLGLGEGVGKGDVAGSLDVVRPPADLLGGNHGGRDPRSNGAGLASGVGQLHSDLLVLAVHELDDLAHGLDLRVLPQTHVLRGDTTLGLHGSRLDHHQSGTPLGDRTQVGNVVGGHVAILGTVLAEGRKLETAESAISPLSACRHTTYTEAVLESKTADGQRLIELGDRLAASLRIGCRTCGRILSGGEVGDARSGRDINVGDRHGEDV
ncbi:uncharacterized protein BO95DRAFT_358067 [Aspergillus brunneoviolaceus CBS 621.78]|uniref:Uncharacterized protein n=1 Tax=Aspergillus brunneoviolaceus CBS 621.78 TaxID=1450534 RepID=A0ACD1GF15_9EURO|nr:hypothetical protein BO95DRAFT_358067 [Aspergillus brunneoviolaceus CBS 621.78]RAH47825.1 hypothetical protein BO95DRAFT_358067 [Aspergillus brunneoviolaceus CBS 621.78]